MDNMTNEVVLSATTWGRKPLNLGKNEKKNNGGEISGVK